MGEMEEMNYMNAMRLDKGLEEGYTCKRCRWGGRPDSMRLMDLTALENHGRTVHRLNGAMLEDFLKDPQLDRRPSAPQTPIAAEPQSYPRPTPIDDSAMLMALEQYNQNIGPNSQGALPPQTFNVPAHMSPSHPQQPNVFHGQSNIGSPQLPPPVFQGQTNQMAPPQLAGQNYNLYWASGHVYANHNVQMANQYHGSPPQQLQGFAHPMNYQEPANHHFQFGNQYQMHPPVPPEGYMTVVTLYPEEAPQSQSVHNPHEAEDRIRLQHASKRLREGHYKFLQLHHDCVEERKDPDKAAQNPLVVGNLTLTELYFFITLYKDLGSIIEKQWLQNRYPWVYSAWQKWEFEKGQGRPQAIGASPVVQMQLEANNSVNTSQCNNATATNRHNPAASLNQHDTNQSSTTPGPASVQNSISNNPFKEPHKSILKQAGQKILRQRSLSFQRSLKAAGTPSQPASNKSPGVNTSSLQQGQSSQAAALPPTPKNISPTMDNQVVANQTTDQDSSLAAPPKSATPTSPIHSKELAVMTNPSASGVSVTSGLASDLASTSQENVSKENLGSEASNSAEGTGLASNAKSPSQVEGSRVIAASPQLQKKTNSTSERKRQFGAYENNGDSTTLEVMAAKKPRFPNPILPGSRAQTANGSQRLAETSMSNSSGNNTQSTLLTAGNRDHSMAPPARPASQQPTNGLETIHNLRDLNYRQSMGLEPIHNLSDVKYRQFLATNHPNFDLGKVWSYEQLVASLDDINKNQPGYLWNLFMRQFSPDHRRNLANCGLWPFFRAGVEFKDFDEGKKTLYRKTALAELMALMLTRLHNEKGVFSQQLQERDEAIKSIMEERRKEEEEQKQKTEEERRKVQDQRGLILEDEEREDAERKKRLLDRAKEVVEEKYPPVVYEERCRMLVGCDPIFQLPDQRTWVKRQLEEEEYLKDLLDFERLTAEDWEYITTSNPEPIRQRSTPPVNNLDDVVELH